VLVIGGGSTLALTAVVVVLAGIVSGGPGAAGAAVGAALALVVFVAGTLVVGAVARLVPSAALLVALMTFTLQVLLMALVFWRLTGSGLLDDGTLHRGWLAAALIGATLTWSAGQIVAVTKARIPVYDLPGGGVR